MLWQHQLDGKILEEIGLLLKQLRKNAGYSQQELADKIGVNRKLIGDIERGENTSLLVIIKLLKVYNRLDLFKEILHSSTISPKEQFLKKG